MVRLFTRTAFGLAVALGASALLGTPAQALVFKTTLSPEALNAAGSGNATLLIDEVTNNMYIDVNFQGLSGITTASHIHGPTANPFTGTAGVMTTTPTFSGFPLGVSSGTYTNTLNLLLNTTYRAGFITANGGIQGARDAFLAALIGKKAYLNIHSSTFPGGEIRGFFVQQVPGPLPIVGVGVAMAWSRRLRRRLAASAT
ncbi:MAG: CHRD domain-containing protein [Cyanobacteria bacterium]|nr:CHRD domain-containing protein [Cyanobacteriota bacterium]